MDDLVTERQQKAQVGGFDLHFLRFLLPFRPMTAQKAEIGRKGNEKCQNKRPEPLLLG